VIERAAESLARRIHMANEEETASIPVLKFALVGLFNNGLTLLIILLAGYALGMFREAFVAFVSFMLLRVFAGGFHFRSAAACMAVSVLSIVAATWLSRYVGETGTIAVTAASLVPIALFAPSNIKKTRIKPSWRPYYKMAALLIVASNFIWQSPLLALVFLLQAISTIEIDGRNQHDEKAG
jgi:accessory gene regulator B